jgi:predicted nucleic acid-binding protein
MAAINVALDTNILAYAEGTNGPVKQQIALALIEGLSPDSTFLPVHTLGELYNVLVRKAGRPALDARQAILGWGDAFPLIESSSSVILSALDLAVHHRFGIWDAMILSAAADAECRLLLSEDLQGGFTWSGVTVVNPFSRERHPLLDASLGAPANAPETGVPDVTSGRTSRRRARRR